MNRTVQLLEDALRDESAVPDGIAITARLPGLIRQRRRRHLTLSAATAAVAVLALAGSVVAILRPPAPSNAATGLLSAPTLTEVFQPDRSVSVERVMPGGVEAVVITPEVQATLLAYASGQTRADVLAVWRDRGQPVTVNRRPGFFVFGESSDLTSGVFPAGRPPTPFPTLAWEYAPDAWAFLGACATCGGARLTLLNAAALVVFGPAAPITAPVRFGYLPDDWRLTGLDRLGRLGNGPFFSRGDRPYQLHLRFSGADPARWLGVTMTPADGTDWGDGWAQRFRAEQTINGHPVMWNGENMPTEAKDSAWADFGQCHVQVDTSSHAQTIRVLEKLEAADCTDVTTWWDATATGARPAAPQRQQSPIWLPIG